MRKSLLFITMLFITACSFTSLYAQNVEIPDFSSTPRKDVPEKFTWNEKDIYASMDAWKQDKEALAVLIPQIDSKREGWTNSGKSMLEMYELLDKISLKAAHVLSYLLCLKDVDLGNSTYQALLGETQPLMVDLGAKMAFHDDDVSKLDVKKLDEFYKAEPKLLQYKVKIDNVLRVKAHVLPADKEELVSMTSLFSGTAQGANEILNNVEIPAPEVTLSDGQKATLNFATYLQVRASKNPEDRSLAVKTFWENRAKYEKTIAQLFNGEMKKHYYFAKVYKYDNCLQSALDASNIDTEVYTKLISEVHANLAPLHKYLTLKKELLGLKEMKFEDQYASAVKKIDKKFSYDDATKIVLQAVQPLGNEYVSVMKQGFENRWVDIYPNKDKQYGAYSRGVYGIHPYVKMNYNGKYDAVSTLAHEMGHSMHTYLSEKNQPFALAEYTLFLAEIASTFNENMLIEYMLKNEKDDLFKLYLLDNYLDQVRNTLYQQTAFAEFELAMHRRVEDGKVLTADWLNETYLQTLRTYYGHDKGVLIVNEYFKHAWTSVPHFFYNFYVYQYSTGILASLALSNAVLQGGQKDADRYLTMLKSGSSDYSLNLLKKAGVDMTSAEPYKAGFARFEKLVDEMAALVKKLKAEGKI
ncbi:MAG: oligoendopeptidase F [Ignavibacteria bacterium]|nr:oligoendopeptidase F [Ignavibacteria bacterium]